MGSAQFLLLLQAKVLLNLAPEELLQPGHLQALRPLANLPQAV
jgi:hypothetical protein